MCVRLLALAMMALPGATLRRRASTERVGQRDCANLSSPVDDVLGFFRSPRAQGFPWFNYLIWLDQPGLADAGAMYMQKVDPEALAYLTPPARVPGVTEIHRCGERRWSLFGNNISGPKDSTLMAQGEEFMRGFSDSRCKLKFDWNSEGTKARIRNYFWATLRMPNLDSSRVFTIEVNPHFRRLFEAVSKGSFWPALKRAVAAEGDWGRTCCPLADSMESGPLDVIAACRPPVVQDCALWMRRNDPPKDGYQLYAVAYQSGDAWAPVLETGGTTAYATFAASMRRVGVESICFERDS